MEQSKIINTLETYQTSSTRKEGTCAKLYEVKKEKKVKRFGIFIRSSSSRRIRLR